MAINGLGLSRFLSKTWLKPNTNLNPLGLQTLLKILIANQPIAMDSMKLCTLLSPFIFILLFSLIDTGNNNM